MAKSQLSALSARAADIQQLLDDTKGFGIVLGPFPKLRSVCWFLSTLGSDEWPDLEFVGSGLHSDGPCIPIAAREDVGAAFDHDIGV